MLLASSDCDAGSEATADAGKVRCADADGFGGGAPAQPASNAVASTTAIFCFTLGASAAPSPPPDCAPCAR